MISTSLPLPFDTRRSAHARVEPTKERSYRRILDFARTRRHYGFTANELAALWNCDLNHVAPRVSELAKQGKMIDSKRRRPTRSESPARVCVLPEFA
jgi:hypothetical protein